MQHLGTHVTLKLQQRLVRNYTASHLTVLMVVVKTKKVDAQRSFYVMRPPCCSRSYVIIMITPPLGPTVAPQVMFGLFTACTAAYGYYLWRHKKVVHKVHMLMMALIFFKVWTVLSQALMYHYIEATGSADGWNIAYYVFTFFRGILFFTVVVLIGTGEGGRSWRVGGLSYLVGC